MSLKIPLPKRKLPPLNKQASNADNINNINSNNFNNINNQASSRNENNYEEANNEEEQIRKKRREELQRLIDQEELEKQKLERFVDIPEFLKRGENEQAIISYMRMRQRNFSDGAMDFPIDPEDLENDNIELYENKCINLAPAEIIEDIDKVPKYYIESLSRDKFFELKKDPSLLEKNDNELETDEKQGPLDKYISEEELTKKEDEELEKEISNTIFKISNNVSIIFLLAQGLLAGISLVNIMMLFQYEFFNSFVIVYSKSVELIFNFTHCLTFGSLVGNGIKLVSTHRFYDKLKEDYYFNNTKKSKIKRKLIILHIAFWLFVAAFIILLVLASYIPKIKFSSFTKGTTLLITENEFNTFKTLFLVVDIIVIVNFFINVFDISKVSDLEFDSAN
jgi:hypothetical protein